MVYTASSPNNLFGLQQADISTVVTRFQSLKTDDKLGLLWFAYTEIGRSITPAAPGAARLQFAEGLLNQVKEMTHNEQLQFMRDLANKVSTPLTRSYGVLTTNTKLAFWYILAELMEQGTVVPVPANYKMSKNAQNLLATIQSLDFNQQITVLRKTVSDMGIDPLA